MTKQLSAATAGREFRTFLLMAQFEAKEIGARIAQARREAGLTQEQLAEMAPFSTRSLSDYETGATIPYRQLRDISRLLDRPVEWFLHGDKEEQPPPALVERLVEIERKLDLIDRKLDRNDATKRLVGLQEQLRDLVRAARSEA